MRCALFAAFKGARTLLLWGEAPDLVTLENAFRQLERAELPEIVVGNLAGTPTANSVQVRFVIAHSENQAILIQETPDGRELEFRFRQERYGAFAAQMGPLRHAGAPRHCYLDVGLDQPLQVMVSFGEYPDNFSS